MDASPRQHTASGGGLTVVLLAGHVMAEAGSTIARWVGRAWPGPFTVVRGLPDDEVAAARSSVLVVPEYGLGQLGRLPPMSAFGVVGYSSSAPRALEVVQAAREDLARIGSVPRAGLALATARVLPAGFDRLDEHALEVMVAALVSGTGAAARDPLGARGRSSRSTDSRARW